MAAISQPSLRVVHARRQQLGPVQGQLGAIWASGVNVGPDKKTSDVVMQGDGNLVVYEQGAPVWSSGTSNKPGWSGPYNAQLQDDGALVIYGNQNGNRNALWRANNPQPGEES